MPIIFDADKFRETARQAGDETLEQISARTGVDVPLLSRLLTGKRQPMFATAAQCTQPYPTPLGDYIKSMEDTEGEGVAAEAAA